MEIHHANRRPPGRATGVYQDAVFFLPCDTGEQFPLDQKDAKHGPNLTGMGSHHPAEYFAESILEPNEIIITGPSFTGQDGLSIMPNYRDTLTLQQWVDLVAYLKSLTGPEMEENMQMEPKD